MSPAAKGKRQVVLTLSTEAYEKLWELATENDRTLDGYLRWLFYSHLRNLDTKRQESIS